MNHLRFAALVLLTSIGSLAAGARSARAADLQLPVPASACRAAIGNPDLALPPVEIDGATFLISHCTAEPETVCQQGCYDTFQACKTAQGCDAACQTACQRTYALCSCSCPPGDPI